MAMLEQDTMFIFIIYSLAKKVYHVNYTIRIRRYIDLGQCVRCHIVSKLSLQDRGKRRDFRPTSR